MLSMFVLIHVREFVNKVVRYDVRNELLSYIFSNICATLGLSGVFDFLNCFVFTCDTCRYVFICPF